MRHFVSRCTGLVILALLLAGCSSLTGGKESANTTSGEQVFLDHCAGCHNSGIGGDGTEAHVPPQSALHQMPASRILRALDFGAMMTITYALTRDERVAVANYLGVPDDGKPPVANFCADRSVTLADPATGDWTGWSPGAEGRGNARFQEHAGFTEAQVGRLKLKWVIGFDGDINSFAPPAVLGSNLFLGSASGLVQALDRNTGCTKWVYQADGPVRSAMRLRNPWRARRAPAWS
ncbi:MAG: c-type cytochrome, partial [Acidobacteriota bacterium]